MARRTKAQWRALINEQKSSGLIAAEFCRRKGIKAKYFSLRKRQLGSDGEQFVQVVPCASSRAASAEGVIKLRVIELSLPQSAVIESLALLLNTER